MKKLACIIISLTLFVIFAYLSVQANPLPMYATSPTHPHITLISLNHYKYSSFPSITDDYIAEMMQGSIEEDDYIFLRSKNHFYDFFHRDKSMLGNYSGGFRYTFESAKQWAQDYVAQLTFSNGLDGGPYTWQEAIKYYRLPGEDNRKKAFRILGHILHLIQDMTVPAHTRDDLHFPDTYEAWVKENANILWSVDSSGNLDIGLPGSTPLLQGTTPLEMRSLDEYFDWLSIYSQSNFASDDTIPGTPGGMTYNNWLFPVVVDRKIITLGSDYVYILKGKDPDGGPNDTINLAYNFKIGNQVIYSLKLENYNITGPIYQEYWKRLGKMAARATAGVVKLFLAEVAKNGIPYNILDYFSLRVGDYSIRQDGYREEIVPNETLDGVTVSVVRGIQSNGSIIDEFYAFDPAKGEMKLYGNRYGTPPVLYKFDPPVVVGTNSMKIGDTFTNTYKKINTSTGAVSQSYYTFNITFAGIEPVTTLAGTFTDCLKYTGQNEYGPFTVWIAKDIGIVKEITSVGTENPAVYIYSNGVEYGTKPSGTSVTGYWEMVLPSSGKYNYFSVTQNGNSIAAQGVCGNTTTWTGTISGNSISYSIAKDGVTFNCSGTVNGTTVQGICPEGGPTATWSATIQSQAPTDKQCVIGSTEVFCMYFPNNSQYAVASVIEDPKVIVQLANISGSNIASTIPYSYNLYPYQLGKWWTNPNILISTGTIPTFPLNYSVGINFKDGTSSSISKSVTTYELAQ
jgi:hypothetical protein